MKMELCSSGHDEVCFEGRNCPACALAGERDEKQGEIEKLQERIETLETELEKVEAAS
jgi:predicted nuclease with TOPRIM domain